MNPVHPTEHSASNSKKYRQYATEVDKALKFFENTSDWPDMINALGRLGKALQSYSKHFTDIPKTVIIAKRISQCFSYNSSGVHLKALETSKIAFSILARGDQLSNHLYLFSVGLFPLMEKCGIKVKPSLFSVFEQFLIPMGPKLRPALTGFISALLLALEEGSEFYGRVFDLLDRVMENSGPLSFYACLWEAVSGNPDVRLAALDYVNKKFDRRKPAGDQLAIICGGPEHADYMTAAFCAAADDLGNVLIQRNLLDFLCTAIPLNSDHIIQADLVQILRRCLFVLLRRDISLNRRLYQWLLNRSNDGSLNLGGADEITDLEFFNTYSIPLIRQSVASFMEQEVVEISTQHLSYFVGSSQTDKRKEQIEFTEVRLCRLLHYFLDRPELGMPIVNETLLMFLEYACKRDSVLLKGLQTQCEEVDSSFSFGSFWDSLVNVESNLSQADKTRRLNEIRKNFNSLLDSLEPGFLWQYLANLFVKLLEPLPFKTDLTDEEEASLTIEEQDRRLYMESKRKEHLMLYPLMLVFCVRNVHLDAHSDIRGRHISGLLQTLLNKIIEHGCDHFSRDNLVALLCASKRLLLEVSHGVSVVEPESASEEDVASVETENDVFNSSLKENTIEGQKMVEACLLSCRELLSQVCNWYVNGRERDKSGVLFAISSLLRDFSDFPMYCLSMGELCKKPINRYSSSSNTYHTSTGSINGVVYSNWLSNLLKVVDIDNWYQQIQANSSVNSKNGGPNTDFDVRAKTLDLLLYFYVKSTSVLEQHSALFVRQNHSTYLGFGTLPQKTTTTILLRPFVNDVEITKLEDDEVFRKSAYVLWSNLADTNESINAQIVSNLLIRLHSRKISDSSSDVEEIIVHDLTSSNKLTSGSAAKKFRILWALNRNLNDEEYAGLTQKPLNRVVMVMLGFLTDDLLTSDCAELRAIAYTWFVECAKHNDLYKILQMLFLMLLTPASARVSIQYLQLDERTTHNELPSLPDDVNVISLSTMSGKQNFHHVCRDIDAPMNEKTYINPAAPWNEFSFFDCTTNDPWISDVKRHIILQASEISDNSSSNYQLSNGFVPLRPLKSNNSSASINSNDQMNASLIAQPRTPHHPKAAKANSATPSVFVKGHKRTISGIPQFDQDAESVDSISLDESVEQDVLDVVQGLVDMVCADEDHNDTPQQIAELTAPGDSKQPLWDEGHSYMLLYAESPRVVDLGRAEKIFRIIGSLLHNDSALSLGKLIVSTMLFTDTAKLSQSPTNAQSVQQLLDALTRHSQHIHGEGFWIEEEGPINDDGDNTARDRTRGQKTFLEIFSIISFHFLRSYYLNSPVNQVSPEDLALSFKCKIAVLDCFSELMKVVDDLVQSIESREFVSFVSHTYRIARSQKVIGSLMLISVPTPPPVKDWRFPLTTDITEFNNGPNDGIFRGLGFAFQRSLLNVASVLLGLEHHLFIGQRSYGSQHMGVSFGRVYENRQLYNTPQNRSNVRDTRLFGEPKAFISMVLNALRRCNERHELWFNFIINCVPYLDRTLSTFSVNVIDQLCRNIYACMSANFSGLSGLPSDYDQYDSILGDPSTPTTPFDDYRQLRTDIFSAVMTSSNDYPANYAVTLFDTLTTIVHYGLIESTSSTIPFLLMRTSFSNSMLNTQPSHISSYNSSILRLPKHSDSNSGISLNMSSMVGSALSVIPGTKGATEFVSSLMGKVFTSNDHASSNNSQTTKISSIDRKSADWNAAKSDLMKKFPAVFAIVCDAWYFSSYNIQPRTPIGEPRMLCHQILQLLGPIAKIHPQVLTTSAATVWSSRGKPMTKKESDQVSFTYTCYQKVLAQLCLKVLSFAELLNACLDLLKDSSGNKSQNTSNSNIQATTVNLRPQTKDVRLPTPIMEVALLELLHCCMQCLPPVEIRSAWAALNVLFSEVNPSIITPRGCFLMFTILCDFVKLCGAQSVIEDRSISRGCQEACQRITDALNHIIGWQLESTTWLKRTLVVKQDNQKLSDISPTVDYRPIQNSLASETNSIKGSRSSLTTESNRLSTGNSQDTTQMTGSVAQLSTMTNESKKSSSSNVRSSLKDPSNNNRKDPTDSTRALFLLAENLAELIDSISKSEDKEKMLPILQSVWGNTLPYLKAKSARNVRFFLASSQFLASMSSYNYMRSVWKKTTIDLLLDSSFFKMDIHALKHWLIVTDNLMATNDRTAFKELLTKLPSGTSTGLSNLMTSKEQEYEMKAQALKRLAFVILSSELDQYYSNLPEIQEKLSDNLRFNQIPIVHSQIFVCCRVLLIRMRPNNFAVIWPSMITELVQVLMQIEQHLQSATTDELRSPRDEQLLNLFLSACKFLETLCTLPSGYVTHFQMCHWAFVSPIKPDPNYEAFIPFSTRLDTLLTQKFGALTDNDKEVVSASLCNVKSLTGIQELHPFFHALATQHRTKAAAVTGSSFKDEQLRDACYINGTLPLNQALQRLEQSLYVDFAEHWCL